eukprot:355211-Chlamydomonas_euryale.AAC.2
MRVSASAGGQARRQRHVPKGGTPMDACKCGQRGCVQAWSACRRLRRPICWEPLGLSEDDARHTSAAHLSHAGTVEQPRDSEACQVSLYLQGTKHACMHACTIDTLVQHSSPLVSLCHACGLAALIFFYACGSNVAHQPCWSVYDACCMSEAQRSPVHLRCCVAYRADRAPARGIAHLRDRHLDSIRVGRPKACAAA